MKATKLALPEIVLLTPRVFSDHRGSFFESFNARVFRETTGVEAEFVQDNHSTSKAQVIRGLHYQVKHAQGKLVRVIAGSVYDVVVDMRKSSSSFGRWVGVALTADDRSMLWVPPGFAHGFYVTSDTAEVLYKTTDYWAPEHERTLLWNDPAVGVEWPLTGDPVLTPKDEAGSPLAKSEVYP
jgi:dTDP-4-dehydrorhamnose 3,5-epimerase